MTNGQERSDLVFRWVKSELDQQLQKRNVSEQSRANLLLIADLMYQYIDYARTQGLDPTNKTVLAKFLGEKSKNTVKLLGHEGLNCSLAIVDFLLSAGRAGSSFSAASLPLTTITLGMALLDLIEVGNSCDAVQQAYYEAFQRQSSVKLRLLRVRAQRHYSPDKRLCTQQTPWPGLQAM